MLFPTLAIPDDIVIQVVAKRLAEPDTKNGFIIDGFPRTLPQAEALQPILESLTHVDGDIHAFRRFVAVIIANRFKIHI